MLLPQTVMYFMQSERSGYIHFLIITISVLFLGKIHKTFEFMLRLNKTQISCLLVSRLLYALGSTLLLYKSKGGVLKTNAHCLF